MDRNRDTETAREIFERYGEVYQRGHEDYMRYARRLEDYYLAGGRQWLEEDRKKVEAEGRPCYEVDMVKPAVNAVVGYQIANRVDVSFVPRGGEADEASAKLMSKVVRQVMDRARWRYRETDFYLDGLIQQRGFLDIRMDYERNDLGEVAYRVVDPMDAHPDPDASDLDPDTWSDWHETRWLTAAGIEQQYGKDAAELIKERAALFTDDRNFGYESGIERDGFGSQLPGMYKFGRGYIGNEGPLRRYRLVHRQVNEYRQTLVARWPTGDIFSVEGASKEQIQYLLEQGIPVFKRRMRCVRMQLAGPDVLIHDEPSPYDHITVVMFAPFFRRGRTVGMVDNLTSVQDMMNKFISQYAHVVNSSANGGWQGEANSLVNMTDDEFVNNASSTGLVLLRRPNTAAMEKIKPNDIPQGLDRMVEFTHKNGQIVSGVSQSLSGMSARDMSGVAIQSVEYADQQKLALPLDNLSRARHMVVDRTTKCVQKYYGAERVMRITEETPSGVKRHVPIVLNQRMDDGSIINDLTNGTYDMVLSEQPASITFDNSQFNQMIEMRKLGIPINDGRVVRSSNLADKSEIAEELETQAAQTNPVAEAEAALKAAQARKADAEAVNKKIEAPFSAVKTAREIAMTPLLATLADSLLRSAGYVDADAAPIVPQPPAGTAMPGAAMGAENSHPLTPPNPQVGLDAGLTSTTE